jgi:hypothetical protein
MGRVRGPARYGAQRGPNSFRCMPCRLTAHAPAGVRSKETLMTEEKRGGRREGAGRPAKSPRGCGSAANIWLTPEQRAHLEYIGDGSGERRAA